MFDRLRQHTNRLSVYVLAQRGPTTTGAILGIVEEGSLAGEAPVDEQANDRSRDMCRGDCLAQGRRDFSDPTVTVSWDSHRSRHIDVTV